MDKVEASDKFQGERGLEEAKAFYNEIGSQMTKILVYSNKVYGEFGNKDIV